MEYSPSYTGSAFGSFVEDFLYCVVLLIDCQTKSSKRKTNQNAKQNRKQLYLFLVIIDCTTAVCLSFTRGAFEIFDFCFKRCFIIKVVLCKSSV